MIRHATAVLFASLGLTAGISASASASSDSVPAPRFADVSLATGVRLRYAEQGDSGGPAVILLHGYSDSWFSWSRVMPLIPTGYRVIAPDLRGHGDSEQPVGGYAMADFAGDVLALMDALAIERASVVGHSMGSFVAQQVALAAPSRVERLVLVGSATTVRAMPGLSDFVAVVNALQDPVPEQFARDFQVSTIHHPVPDEFLDTAVATSLRLPSRVWRGIMAGMLATAPASQLGSLAVPTLIMSGERDAIFPLHAQRDLRARLPRARSVSYPDTGHAPHWERPEIFAADLISFLPESAVR
jgi:pimeloyl-ACP methyl ester carboxylesterase